jgi:tetratricopeptide (TPR) repeat protein
VTLLPGTAFARYQIIAPLGTGGMGEVYRALDTQLGREVALKVLTRATAGANLDRFLREGRAASNLNHPNIVTIHDVGEGPGGRFIAMELVEGQTLRSLAEAGLPLGATLDIGRQVAQALAAAHTAGIVHRDIKPENIMLRPDGYVKVVDFGLARAVGVEDSSQTSSFATVQGSLIGTLRYMSPEQARGQTLSAATDIFSLGIVLYELATAHHPFGSASHLGVLHGILVETPVSPSSLTPGLPAEFDRLILQMLEKDARLRPTAAEVGTALGRLGNKGEQPTVATPPTSTARAIVGREREREALGRAFDDVAAGHGLLVAVAGEPGIGKSTLVEQFLEDCGQRESPGVIGRGRCSERLAGSEAYLPVLEALESLLADGGEWVSRALRVLAPTWFVQVAPLAGRDSSGDRMLESARAASQERMKREFTAFLAEVSRTRPTILFLDDLHWADVATIDLLAYLAARFDTMRALVVVTYRPSDLQLAGHPFGTLRLELTAKSVYREIQLEFLGEADIGRYLALTFPEHRFPHGLPALVHAKTEGNPLFMVDLVRDLRDRGVLAPEDGWHLAGSIADLERELPESIRSMIQRKLERVSEQDRRLLRAAAVQGTRFDSAIVAEVVGEDPAEVEERLQALDTVHSLVKLAGEREFPDRALTLQFQFVHGLYQNALFGALMPSRRAGLSAAVAQSLLRHYGSQASLVASRLAFLFEHARDFDQAARWYLEATEHAAGLFAHREAAVLARRGIALLQGGSGATPERLQQELALRIALGVALMVIEGYAAPAVEETYGRARTICRTLGDRPEFFPVLWGLWGYYSAVANHRLGMELGEQLLRLSERRGDADRVRARWAIGTSCLFTGRLRDAVDHYEQGLERHDPAMDRVNRHLYGHDAGVTCLVFGAWAIWHLGQPDDAARRADEAVRRAEAMAHAQTLGHALLMSAILYHGRGDVARAETLAGAAMRVADEQGLPQFRAWAAVVAGWVHVMSGRRQTGIALLRESLRAQTAFGSRVGQPHFCSMLASAVAPDDPGEASRILDEAIAQSESSGERLYLGELLRIRAELLAASDPDEAHELISRALESARECEARSLELRILTTAVTIAPGPAEAADRRAELTEALSRFTQGLETPDLVRARELASPTPTSGGR